MTSVRVIIRGGWKYIAICFSLAVGACAQTNTTQYSFGSNDPIINPDPQHIILISIKIPPGVATVLSANIQGTSDDNKCLAMLGLGVFDRIAFRDYLNSPSQSTAERQVYNLIVDKFLPGKCGWSLEGVGIEVKKNNMSGGIGFHYAPYTEKYGDFLTREKPPAIQKSSDDRDIDVAIECKSAKVKNPHVSSGDYACKQTNLRLMPPDIGEHTRTINLTVIDDDQLR